MTHFQSCLDMKTRVGLYVSRCFLFAYSPRDLSSEISQFHPWSCSVREHESGNTQRVSFHFESLFERLALRPDLRLRTLTQSDKNFLRETCIDNARLLLMSDKIVHDLCDSQNFEIESIFA